MPSPTPAEVEAYVTSMQNQINAYLDASTPVVHAALCQQLYALGYRPHGWEAVRRIARDELEGK